jgi:hypothetical protein
MLDLDFVKLLNVSFVKNNLLDNYFYSFRRYKSVTQPLPTSFKVTLVDE